MAVACVVFVVGSILMSASQNQAMLIVARIVNGWAVGMLTSQGLVSPQWTCATHICPGGPADNMSIAQSSLPKSAVPAGVASSSPYNSG